MKQKQVYMINFLGHMEIWNKERDFMDNKVCDEYIENKVEIERKLNDFCKDDNEKADTESYLEQFAN